MNLKDISTEKLIEELKKRDKVNVYKVNENNPYYILIPNLVDVINNGASTIIEYHK